MAVTQAELTQVYSREFVKKFNRSNVARSLVNERHQAELQTNKKVEIPVDDTGVALAAYVHGSDWSSTRDDVDVSYVTLEAIEQKQNSIDIPLDVARELAVDVVANAARRQAITVAEAVDTYIFKTMSVGILAANQSVLGTDSVYVKPDMTPVGTGSAKLPYDALRAIWLAAAKANVATPAADEPSQLWAVMNPYMLGVLMEWLRENGNSELISTLVLRNGQIGRFMGVMDLLISNAVPTKTTSSDVAGSIIVGTNDAVTYGSHPLLSQFFTPDDHSAGPFYRMNILAEYGAVVENTSALFARRIRQAA